MPCKRQLPFPSTLFCVLLVAFSCGGDVCQTHAAASNRKSTKSSLATSDTKSSLFCPPMWELLGDGCVGLTLQRVAASSASSQCSSLLDGATLLSLKQLQAHPELIFPYSVINGHAVRPFWILANEDHSSAAGVRRDSAWNAGRNATAMQPATQVFEAAPDDFHGVCTFGLHSGASRRSGAVNQLTPSCTKAGSSSANGVCSCSADNGFRVSSRDSMPTDQQVFASDILQHALCFIPALGGATMPEVNTQLLPERRPESSHHVTARSSVRLGHGDVLYTGRRILSPTCSVGWEPSGGGAFCYQAAALAVHDGFAEAQAKCASLGGQLAEPVSGPEITDAISAISATGLGGARVYVGLGDWMEEGTVRSLGGRPFNLAVSNSAANNDVLDCIAMVSSASVSFEFVPCDEPLAAVLCEQALYASDDAVYWPLSDLQPWHIAQSSCELRGGHLTVLSSVQEVNYVFNNVATSLGADAFWVGIHDTVVQDDSNFVVLTGQAFPEPLPWRTGAADGDISTACVHARASTSQLGEDECCAVRQAICERSSPQVCPSGWAYHGNFCWKRESMATGYLPDRAQAVCAQQGASLATAVTEGDLRFLSRSMVGSAPGQATAFIGYGSFIFDHVVFVWIDGSYLPIPSDMLAEPQPSAANRQARLEYQTPSLGGLVHFIDVSTPSAAPEAFVCQRPAPHQTFLSCAQGWIPMGDRCIMHSEMPHRWEWSKRAKIPTTLSAADAQGACTAAGGSTLFVPDSFWATRAVSEIAKLQGASSTWYLGSTRNGANVPASPLNGDELCTVHSWYPSLASSSPDPCSGALTTGSNQMLNVAADGTAELGGFSSTTPQRFFCELRTSHFTAAHQACPVGHLLFAGTCYEARAVNQPFWSARWACGNTGQDIAALRSKQLADILFPFLTASGVSSFTTGLVLGKGVLQNFDGSTILSLPADHAQLGSTSSDGLAGFVFTASGGSFVAAEDTTSSVSHVVCSMPARQHAAACDDASFTKFNGKCYKHIASAAACNAAARIAVNNDADLWVPNSRSENWFVKDNLSGVGSGTADIWTGLRDWEADDVATQASFYGSDLSSIAGGTFPSWASASAGTGAGFSCANVNDVSNNNFALNMQDASVSTSLSFVLEKPLASKCPSGFKWFTGQCHRLPAGNVVYDTCLNSICDARADEEMVTLWDFRMWSQAHDFRSAQGMPTQQLWLSIYLDTVSGSLGTYSWADGRVFSYVDDVGTVNNFDHWRLDVPNEIRNNPPARCARITDDGTDLGSWDDRSCAETAYSCWCWHPPLGPHAETSGGWLSGNELGMPPLPVSTLAPVALSCAPSALATPSNLPTQAATRSPSSTSTPTPSTTNTATSSRTPSPSRTPTPSMTSTATPSQTSTSSPTQTPTGTPSQSATATPSQTSTGTPSTTMTGTPSQTATGTPSFTSTASPSQTSSGTPSQTSSVTPSQTTSGTPSNTMTGTPSVTSTGTPSHTMTGTPSVTSTGTPSQTGTPSVTPTSTGTPSVTASATPSQTMTPTPSAPVCPALPALQDGRTWSCTRNGVSRPPGTVIGLLGTCSVQCPPGTQPWGFTATRCGFGSQWEYMDSSGSVVWTADGGDVVAGAFPLTPVCVRSVPSVPGRVTQVDVCQLNAVVEWADAAPSVPLPGLTWASLRADGSWGGWLPSLDSSVSSGTAGTPPMPLAQHTGGGGGSAVVDRTAVATHLETQWRRMASVTSTGLSFYAVHMVRTGDATAPTSTAGATVVGLAGNEAAYRTAAGLPAAGPLPGSPSYTAALSTAMSVRGLPEDDFLWFTVAAGNAQGMSPLGGLSAGTQFFTSKCDLFAITVDARLPTTASVGPAGGAYAAPAIVGASPLSAFDHQGEDTTGSAGTVDVQPGTVDPRLGSAGWLGDLRVPSQPSVPSAASPLLLSSLSTPQGLGFEVRMPNTPGPQEVVTVTCTSQPVGAAVVTPAVFTATAASAAGGVRQWVRIAAVAVTGVSVMPLAQWRRDVSVQCIIVSTLAAGAAAGSLQVYDGLPAITVPLSVLPVAHPFLGDVLIRLPDDSYQSAWSSGSGSNGLPVLPSTVSAEYAQVLAAAGTPTFRARAGGSGGPTGSSPFLVYGGVESTDPSAYFSVTLGGLQNVTLVADCTHRVRCVPSVAQAAFVPRAASADLPVQPFAFVPGVRVYLGSVQLPVAAVSTDGLAIRINMPSFKVFCPTDEDCAGQKAYRALWIANPPVIPSVWLAQVDAVWQSRAAGGGVMEDWVTADDALFTAGEAAWSTAVASARLSVSGRGVGTVLGGLSACPMACPGAGNAPRADGGGSSRRLQSATSGEQEHSLMGYGTFMTASCIGFLPPGPKCRDASDPDHTRCAFGAGDDCQSCGEGALCPGGYRRWPKPGYWTATENSRVAVKSCAPPSTERCTGWNATTAQSGCGVGYQGFVCGQCATGFFPESGGSCTACPADTDGLSLVLPPLIFAGSAFGLFLVMALAIRIVTAIKGGSFGGGLKRAAQFVVWTVSMLQVIVQVGKAASPGLPDFLQDMYTKLNVLQFDSAGLVHPACLNQAAFTSERSTMSVALALLVLAVLLTFAKVRKAEGSSKAAGAGAGDAADADPRAAVGIWGKVKPILRRGSFTLMTLMYAIVTNTVLGLLYCQQAEVDDGSSVATKWLLVSNPFYECFAGEHALPGYMALVLLGTYVIGYPLLTYFWVRRKIHAVMVKSKASQAYRRATAKAAAARAARDAVKRSAAAAKKQARGSKTAAGDAADVVVIQGAQSGGYDSDEEALLGQHLKEHGAAQADDAKKTHTNGRAGSTRRTSLARLYFDPVSGLVTGTDVAASVAALDAGVLDAGVRAKAMVAAQTRKEQADAASGAAKPKAKRRFSLLPGRGPVAAAAGTTAHKAAAPARMQRNAAGRPVRQTGVLNPMFVRAAPGYKVSTELLVRAGRLGSKAALPHGTFGLLSRSAHLLKPAQLSAKVANTDPFAIRDAGEEQQVQGYRDAVLSGSFGSMDAVQQRAKAVRAGLATGQDDAEWLRKDVHGLYVRRTAFHPVLSDPARYSEYAVGGGGSSARPGQRGAGVMSANPLAVLRHGGRVVVGESAAGQPVSAVTRSASTKAGGYGITLQRKAAAGEASVDDEKPANDWCACCGCLCTCCWYTCCCCLCALCCSRLCVRLGRKRSRLAQAWRHRNDARSPEEAELRYMINTAPALVQNSTLAHFLSNDYKAAFFYYRHLTMLVLFSLSITVVFFATVETRNSALLKFFITFLVVMSVAGGMIYESPFLDQEKWKENVKVYSLVLAVTSGLLNYVTFVEGELQEFPMGRNGGRNLSILVFIMSMGLFFILITSFWRVLVRGAEAEAKAFARRRRRLQRIVVDLPHEKDVRYHGANPLVYKTLQLPTVDSGDEGDAVGAVAPSTSSVKHTPGAGAKKRGSIKPRSGVTAPAPRAKPSRRMSMLARSMLDGQYAVAGGAAAALRSSKAQRPTNTGAATHQKGGHGALLRRGDGGAIGAPPRERRGSTGTALAAQLAASRARRGPTAVWTPTQTGVDADKWRAAYATATSQLAVMSGRERQAILREAARERALQKQRLW